MVVVLQAAVGGFSLEVMSSVRAYVAGEAMWSRSQKNAVYFLNLYLHSGDASQFAHYQTSLAVPIGDEFARWALERDPVDVEAARIGFLQGGNHPDDVPGLIWLFRNFSHVIFLRDAIREWAATDPTAGAERLRRSHPLRVDERSHSRQRPSAIPVVAALGAEQPVHGACQALLHRPRRGLPR